MCARQKAACALNKALERLKRLPTLRCAGVFKMCEMLAYVSLYNDFARLYYIPGNISVTVA